VKAISPDTFALLDLSILRRGEVGGRERSPVDRVDGD
jgi:hypothetical protein